jgi:hypothetical protein
MCVCVCSSLCIFRSSYEMEEMRRAAYTKRSGCHVLPRRPEVVIQSVQDCMPVLKL